MSTSRINPILATGQGNRTTEVAFTTNAAGGGSASSGGSIATPLYPTRFDLSVNSARVEGAQGALSSFVTPATGPNTVGGYNGGGVGNKAILGFKGYNGLPLASIKTISWQYEIVSMGGAPTVLLVNPYLNLIVNLNGVDIRIFVIDPTLASPDPRNTGTLSISPSGTRTFTHDTSTNYVQIVNSPNVAPPPSPAIPPPTPVVGPGPPYIIWNNYAFRWSDIIATFPGAVLVEALSTDGGLPKSTNMPAMLLIAGDSGAQNLRYITVHDVMFNGVPA
jgi:hypothetical protein